MRPKLGAALTAAVIATACTTPVDPAVSGLPTLRLDILQELSPTFPGADTLSGRLHFNLRAVAGPGDLLVRHRGDGPPTLAGTATRLERTFRVSSSDRQADVRRLVADPSVDFVEPDVGVEALAAFNDPELPAAWWLHRVEAPNAWERGTGKSLRPIALLDTGVDATHPDLAGQVVGGYDLHDGDELAADDHGHGTHLAGLIAAAGNNGIGGIGVAPGARVLPLKVLGAGGTGRVSALIDGLAMARDRGARVVTLSLGTRFESRALREAVDQALAADLVLVAAAGNAGDAGRFFPAAFPGVMAVGATTPTDTRASFSNHGGWVTIAAPGERILGPWRQRPGALPYATLDGTSLAAAHVAGAAALLAAQHPGWSGSQIRATLEATGDGVRGFELNPAVRRLNLARALSQAVPATPPPVPASPPPPTAPATVTPPTPSPSASAGETPIPFATPTLRPTPRPVPTLGPTPVPPTGTATPTPAVSFEPSTPAPTDDPATPAPAPSEEATPAPPIPTPAVDCPSVALWTPPPTATAYVLRYESIGQDATSITISWSTDVPTVGRPLFGPCLDSLVPVDDDGLPKTLHARTFPNLLPDTTYIIWLQNVGPTGELGWILPITVTTTQ